MSACQDGWPQVAKGPLPRLVLAEVHGRELWHSSKPELSPVLPGLAGPPAPSEHPQPV